jgi:ribosomal RNA-processing protein 36
MKGAGKFEGSSSKIVFEDSEEDEDLSCSSVSSSDEEEETEKELTFEEIHKLRADGSKAVPWKPNQVKKTGRARANKNRYTQHCFLWFLVFVFLSVVGYFVNLWCFYL